MKKVLFAAVSLTALILPIACTHSSTTNIKDLYSNPHGYDGKKILIAGTVKDSVNILGLKYFVVQDATGEIPVITEKAVPNTGKKVRVKGTINQAVAIGKQNYMVILEE